MSESDVSVREVIYNQIKSVAKEHRKVLGPLTEKLVLLESGLDSLCVAILVANLEDELGIDPFGSGDDMQMPVTVGDFVLVYENAMQ